MRPIARPLLLSAAGLLAFLFGGLAADPFRAFHDVNDLRLRAAGVRTSYFAAADGSRLRVRELGPRSAEVPVVLLHGIGAAGDYWTGTALALARSGRTVLLPDAPGSGGSADPVDRSGYGIPARAAAVDALFQSLGLAKADVVGHSLGGWTGAAFSLAAPHRIHRLVLVDGAGFSVPKPGDEERRRAELSPTTRGGSLRLFDLLFFRKPFPGLGFVIDSLGRNYRRENVVETLAQLTERDFLVGHERELPAGTVFLWGERDPICPIGDARTAAGLARDARFLFVTATGHDLPLEAPELFEKTLRSVLAADSTR